MHLILRLLYIVLSYLLVPVLLLHLFYKGLGNRDYWRRNGERFGFYPGRVPAGAIWVHAVSVGEVQAAAALVLFREIRPVRISWYEARKAWNSFHRSDSSCCRTRSLLV